MAETIRTAKSFFNNVPDLAGAIRKMVEENEAYKKQMEEIAKEKTLALKSELKGKARDPPGKRSVIATAEKGATGKNHILIVAVSATRIAEQKIVVSATRSVIGMAVCTGASTL
jgi:hypothetical protein